MEYGLLGVPSPVVQSHAKKKGVRQGNKNELEHVEEHMAEVHVLDRLLKL